MANVIQIKRGLEADLPLLNDGEFGFTLDKGNLYIGNGTSNIHLNPVGGVADTANSLATPRLFSASGDAIAPSVQFNGTANVDLVMTLAASGVIAGTYGKVTVNSKGLVTEGAQITISDIGGLGTAAAADIGVNEGNVVGVGPDGRINASLIPQSAITDVFVVANEQEMLALNAHSGDVAVRSDLTQSFILQSSPASVKTNWVILLTPVAPVLSVAGRTGVITLTKEDVGLDRVQNLYDSERVVMAATQLTPGASINGINFNGSQSIVVTDATKMPLTGGIFTGAVELAPYASFDGTQGDVMVNTPEGPFHATNKLYVDQAIQEGTVAKANTLVTPRNFSITGGAIAAAVSFNGSANAVLNVTSLNAAMLSGTIDGGSF